MTVVAPERFCVSTGVVRERATRGHRRTPGTQVRVRRGVSWSRRETDGGTRDKVTKGGVRDPRTVRVQRSGTESSWEVGTQDFGTSKRFRVEEFRKGGWRWDF